VKLLGIVGGIAPASTVDYYERVIGALSRRTNVRYPPLVITSIDLDRMLGLIQSGRFPELTEYLIAEINRLRNAGAELALFASNTPHIVFDELQRRSPIPLISIVEATRDFARAAGQKRLGLFGTRFTMQGGFYQAAFRSCGLEVIVPADEEQDYIHSRYMSELVRGDFREETRAAFVEIARKLAARAALDALILGGTEIPLLLRGSLDGELQLLDTTAIHVERAVDHVLS
jgi:aspartate racemase